MLCDLVSQAATTVRLAAFNVDSDQETNCFEIYISTSTLPTPSSTPSLGLVLCLHITGLVIHPVTPVVTPSLYLVFPGAISYAGVVCLELGYMPGSHCITPHPTPVTPREKHLTNPVTLHAVPGQFSYSITSLVKSDWEQDIW